MVRKHHHGTILGAAEQTIEAVRVAEVVLQQSPAENTVGGRKSACIAYNRVNFYLK